MITASLSGVTVQWIQTVPDFAQISELIREKILAAPLEPYRRGWRVNITLDATEAEELVTVLDDIAGYGESQHNLSLDLFHKYRAVRKDSLRWAELFS